MSAHAAQTSGGPGPILGLPRRGATTPLARRPRGLQRGPAATRRANPTANTALSHSHPVTSAVPARNATPPATTRAAFSLTTAGNPKALRTLPITPHYAPRHTSGRVPSTRRTRPNAPGRTPRAPSASPMRPHAASALRAVLGHALLRARPGSSAPPPLLHPEEPA